MWPAILDASLDAGHEPVAIFGMNLRNPAFQVTVKILWRIAEHGRLFGADSHPASCQVDIEPSLLGRVQGKA